MRDLMKERIKRDQAIGARIREKLHEKNILQKDLATAIGVVNSTVSLYLYGSMHITKEKMQQIADVLGMTVEELEEK